jgi:lysophospholipase L1-like esterase
MGMPFSRALARCTGAAAFWLLLPISAAQGLWLRRRALRLPPPPGDTYGQYGDGSPALIVLAAGDSIIAGIGADHQLQALPAQFARALSADRDCPVVWSSAGVNGANVNSLLQRLAEFKPERAPDIVLLSIGVNDVTGLTSTRLWRQRLAQQFETIRSRWPQALLVFAGLPPMERFPLPPQPLRMALGWRARILDQAAAELLSSQHRMLHVATEINPREHGFCADGFHPSGQSCALWATGLVQRLRVHDGYRSLLPTGPEPPASPVV